VKNILDPKPAARNPQEWERLLSEANELRHRAHVHRLRSLDALADLKIQEILFDSGVEVRGGR
jgi:hypothetical protein